MVFKVFKIKLGAAKKKKKITNRCSSHFGHYGDGGKELPVQSLVCAELSAADWKQLEAN